LHDGHFSKSARWPEAAARTKRLKKQLKEERIKMIFEPRGEAAFSGLLKSHRPRRVRRRRRLGSVAADSMRVNENGF